jgi:hypothetical protein
VGRGDFQKSMCLKLMELTYASWELPKKKGVSKGAIF